MTRKRTRPVRRALKWAALTGLVLGVLCLLLIFYADFRIDSRTRGLVYDRPEDIPDNEVGLVLGTSKYRRTGQPNPFFDHRISAALELYRKGKIRKLVISGDNRRKTYNEPRDMRDALVKKGMPEDDIFLDYAGFRTYDSVFRMKEIFGQSRFTVISQEFHNRRAIYIAGALGLTAVGFNAADVGGLSGLKIHARELLARVNALMDIYLKKRPKFLGEKVPIR